MKIDLMLIILALPLLALTQDDDFADNAPVYKSNYYVYHHFIDDEELKYIKSLRKLPEDTLKVLDEGLADKLVGAKTIKIGNDKLLVESDFYDGGRLKTMGNHILGIKRDMRRLLVEREQKLVCDDTYIHLYLEGEAYSNVIDRLFMDPTDKAFMKGLVGYWLPEPYWGLVRRYDGAPKNEKNLDAHLIRDTQVAILGFASQYLGRLYADRFLRIPLGLGFGTSILKGVNWGDGTRLALARGETGEAEKITLNTYPEWTDAIWRHYNDPKAATYGQEKYKLKYIVEGTHDGLEMVVTLKLWAFCDWMLLQKRQQLSAFLLDLHERVEKKKKENQEKPISTEQMKRMVTDALEKAFGKSLDAIEDDLKAYVKERYFTVADAKLMEKYCIFKEAKIGSK